MGITTVRATLVNVHEDERKIDAEMVLDSGAIYSVVPATILRRIGVEPRRTETLDRTSVV